jgi:acetyltransferase
MKAPTTESKVRAARRSLSFLFAPQSVAVIGASERAGSVGRKVMENLASFPGKVYPVNPNHPTVLGKPAFPSVSAIRAPVDLALIATPAAGVPAVVRDCGRSGVKGVVILSVGFKETGPSGTELERQVREEADRYGMRILGPNCLGVMAPHAGLNASLASGMARKGNIAFVSQSGALCSAILGWSFKKNLGFSAFVSVGTMADIGWGDLIDHLGEDPATHSIVVYMESVGDARSFLSAAREVAFTKPVIVIKVGRSDAAAGAVASHTGELLESDEALDAAFRRVGVLRVDTIEDLFELAELVGKQPAPRGPRLAIVTNAGGPGALAADMLVSRGGRLADLGQANMAALDGVLPPTWKRSNPVDVQGDADAARYARALEIAVGDPSNDGVLVILTPQAMTEPEETARALAPLARTSRKPILTAWMGGDEMEPSRRILTDAGFPVFEYPDAAARAFCYLWQRSSNLRSLYETPALSSLAAGGRDAKATVERIVEKARRAGRTLLTELESKQVIAAYGIPATETRLARTEKQAVALAAKMGYPVVLKVHSQTIAHKAQAGGVALDLANRTAVQRAWRTIKDCVEKAAGKGHFLGVTVQPYVPARGLELIVGSSVTPPFGPVVLFGAGGDLVEVMRDHALGLPPLTANLAGLVIDQTRISSALAGTGGRRPVSKPALEQLLVRFSQLVASHPRIKEIDINPLHAEADRLLALDARVVLHDPSVGDAELPRLAIRPYPFHYVRTETLRDGTPITIRPIRAEDEPMMVALHKRLSADSVYNRYFAVLKLEQRIAHERLSRLCFIDYDRQMALVALHTEPSTGEQVLMGVGRLVKQKGDNSGEFAVLVDDRWQGRGLGARLLGLLVDVGRDEGLDRVTGEILADNSAMKATAKKVGFRLKPSGSEGTVRADIDV